MRFRYGDATHVSCAYRLEEAFGPYNQEGLDDQEHGAGRTILNILKKKNVKNVCIFIARWCGEVKLGKRRFEILEQMAENAITAMQYKMKDRKSRLNRSLSQSSLRSAASMESLNSEASFNTVSDEAEEAGEENQVQQEGNSTYERSPSRLKDTKYQKYEPVSQCWRVQMNN